MPPIMARRKKGRSGTGKGKRRREFPVGWALFALAFVLRLLFWQATPDASWPHSAWYKGDAPLWLDYAKAIQIDEPFELGLPLRPPANGYLLATLWNGEPSGIGFLKLVWCLLGAATVVLLYAAVRRAFSPTAALVVGLYAAGSSALLVLSTSLNNETPYLFLVALALWLWPRVREGGRGLGAAFGAVNALACLVRVEHALFFALVLGALAIEAWRREECPGQAVRGLVPVGLAAFLVLLPWHLAAWKACREFNHAPPQVNAATEQAFQQIEAALAGVRWQGDARSGLLDMPAAVRRTMEHFVAATALVRRDAVVDAEDLGVIEEAFGSIPEPLPQTPFVALYGGLNFYLANHEGAPPGFSRGPLDAPPPLTGGANRYPTPLVAGLPPPDLALTYPPHLAAVNHGYALGLSWITEHPADFAALAWARLGRLWSGATLGFGGWGLPFGLEGPRHAVDLVIPEGGVLLTLWRLLLLAVLVAGLWMGRRRLLALWPWLAFLLTKLVATLAFFGYARQGATLVPVLALALALLVEPYWERLPKGRVPQGALACGLLLVVLEGVRFLSPPEVRIDDRPAVTAGDPWPLAHHRDRQIEFGP